MPVFYNVLGSQNIVGSLQQDQFYAFTSDTNLNNVRADATLPLLSWTTGIRTSATGFLTLSRANIQISSDFYSGGEKVDTIFGSNFNDAILYNNGVVSGIFGSFSSIEQMELGAGDDIVDLTAHGAGGLDYGKNITIRAGAGDDIIIGGAGLDTLYGDDGNDLIFGYRGADTLYGGTGDDRLYGDDLGFNGIAGADFLYGEAGDDFLDGGARGDFLNGGEGNDILIGGAGDDSIFGDIGVDTAVFSGNRNDYSIVWDATILGFRIADLRPGAPDGNDIISGVEYFQFADGTIVAPGPNYHPVITSNGGGISATIAINENSTSVTTVFAVDVDSGQTVTYSIIGGFDAHLFEINPVTGELSFRSAPDFESPTDVGGDNIYNLIVQASDGINSDLQQIAVTVGNVNDNSPVIITNGGGATASVSVNENIFSVTQVGAVDADGTVSAYSIVGGADAELFSIDPRTGILAFTNAPDFENPGDTDGNNVYEVIVQASDGVNAAQQLIKINIGNVNDASPSINSNGGGATATVQINENTVDVTTVSATDADSPTLIYSIAGGSDSFLFTVDPQSGVLKFKGAPNFEAPQDSNGDNIYEVTLRASDGTNSDLQSLSVIVGNVNDNPPVIIPSGPIFQLGVIDTSITENIQLVETVKSFDGDGSVITYSISGGADAALFVIDPQSGALSFANAPDFENPEDSNLNNVYEVTVRASDGAYFDELTYRVTVTDAVEGGRLIIGSSGNNSLTPTATNAAYQTTPFDDMIYGLAGNDIIDGGTGADIMDGGAGDDVYYVDQYSDDGNSFNDDRIIELQGGGLDLVNSTVSYSISNSYEVENLTLIGSAAINGTGNANNNVLTGNGATNILMGDLGDDFLFGGAGDDILYGGAGQDRLDGGTGADLMSGGDGADIYVLDTFSDDGISTNDDQVIEFANGGEDTIIASFSYTLGSELENLTLTGSAISGTGNSKANILNGNGLANTLSGMDGNDIINGARGDDLLRGGGGNDVIDGGDGNDSLYGDIGNDSLLGGAGNDIISGGAGNDTINGQSGQDTLIGGSGRDSLNGGTDTDVFRFNFGDTTTVSTSIDIITDFTTGSDKIDLDFVNGGISAAAYSEGLIATNSFTDALTSAQAMLSGGKSVAFVAGSTDGWLFWDTNGDGVIDQSILLKGVGSLGGFDFTDIM